MFVAAPTYGQWGQRSVARADVSARGFTRPRLAWVEPVAAGRERPHIGRGRGRRAGPDGPVGRRPSRVQRRARDLLRHGPEPPARPGPAVRRSRLRGDVPVEPGAPVDLRERHAPPPPLGRLRCRPRRRAHQGGPGRERRSCRGPPARCGGKVTRHSPDADALVRRSVAPSITETARSGAVHPQTGMVAWRWSTIPSPKSRGSRRSRVESRCAAAALAKQSVATRDVRAKVRRRIGGGAWGDANEYSIQWNNSRWREEAGRRVYAHPSCAASRRAEGATPTRVVLA